MSGFENFGGKGAYAAPEQLRGEPLDARADLFALGLTAAPLPESVGGAGFSYLGWTLVMEELGAADMASAVSLSVHILSQYPVVTWRR